MQDFEELTKPFQFIYLHQRQMLPRYRIWAEFLSKCRSVDIEGLLVEVGTADPLAVLADAPLSDWQVLIYEPPGYPRSST